MLDIDTKDTLSNELYSNQFIFVMNSILICYSESLRLLSLLRIGNDPIDILFAFLYAKCHCCCNISNVEHGQLHNNDINSLNSHATETSDVGTQHLVSFNSKLFSPLTYCGCAFCDPSVGLIYHWNPCCCNNGWGCIICCNGCYCTDGCCSDGCTCLTGCGDCHC